MTSIFIIEVILYATTNRGCRINLFSFFLISRKLILNFFLVTRKKHVTISDEMCKNQSKSVETFFFFFKFCIELLDLIFRYLLIYMLLKEFYEFIQIVYNDSIYL